MLNKVYIVICVVTTLFIPPPHHRYLSGSVPASWYTWVALNQLGCIWAIRVKNKIFFSGHTWGGNTPSKLHENTCADPLT